MYNAATRNTDEGITLQDIYNLLESIDAKLTRTNATKPRKSTRQPVTKTILKIMRDGKVHTAYNLIATLSEHGITVKLQSMQTTLSKLCQQGLITRVHTGHYTL